MPQDDIKPINEQEAQQITQRFEKVAIGVQVCLNAAQRQAMTNLGMFSLLGEKSMNLSRANLTNGLGARVLYQVFGVYPALVVRKHLTQQGDVPQFAISLASCSAETFVGAPLETLGSKKTLAALGVPISNKQLADLTCKVFFPIYFRNYFTWLAINQNCEDTTSKAVYGAFAGFLTTPLQNISVQTMANGADKSWEATAKIVMKTFERTSASLFTGWGFRTISIAAAALFLGPETTGLIENTCRKIAALYQDQERLAKPSTSTKADASSKVVTEVNEHKK